MKYVLFVCTHNAGRSQMAQAFFEEYAPDDVRAESAGQEPADAPWPEVVEARWGSTSRGGRRRRSTWRCTTPRRRAITLNCEGQCPYVPGMVEDWDVEDPRGRPIEKVREIRDDVKRRVEDLIENRLDAIRTDPTSHRIRLQRLLPQLIEEFEGQRDPEVIRACADAALKKHADAPVRSFVLTLAYREARECLREDECALIAV